MTFLENIFGISPDGGSGTIELLLIALPMAIYFLLRSVRKGARQRS